MKILKASAGSGKTYRLSRTYLELLLGSRERDAYRHILAVTFTNKATAEMKSRILDDLAALAADNPRAKRLLVDILHDYGAFSVSTIDRFFQQTLKAFSREIGQFADYQIELDKEALIMESMDRILDSLTEDQTDLVDWIKNNVSENLEQGRKVKIEDSLYEMGKLLKSDECRELASSAGGDCGVSYDKRRLKAIHENCRRIIADFTAKAAELGFDTEPGEKIKMPGTKKLKEEEVEELFGEPYRHYCTALILDKLTFSLGLADEFYGEFDMLLKEKNVMCLDESNTILRDIIAGSDAPFIYEKTGVRYSSFLLDEFQDTSNIQWMNFLPLLKESESHGGGNLIVGDVKQSIYRFRDSDWELLAGKVLEEFPDADVETMTGNWRSTSSVVNFNNRVFTGMAERLGLSEIYSDVRQTVNAKDSQPGFVKVSFCEDQIAEVLSSIAEVRKSGARWGDMAVLVRNKKHGAEIAYALVREGIPVISDDSLNLKSSIVVRRLISLLSGFENPEDTISRFLAESLAVDFPSSYRSLIDLCEALLRQIRDYDPASFSSEALFIQAFMDDLQSWISVNGNSIRNYLRHWDEASLFIGSPESSDSVRVLTIHKSKGLEFPFVIFPYADKVDLYKGSTHWCRFDADGTPFIGEAGGIYPVELGSSSETTGFEGAYREEKRKQAVDNLNLFYVALTRAGKAMHIICRPPTKKCQKSLEKGPAHYSNMSEVLFDVIGRKDTFMAGSMYDFALMERKDRIAMEPLDTEYVSIPIGGRLSLSADTCDFFGEDGKVGASASARLNGIVLHDILSSVIVADDLCRAVDAAVDDGRFTPAEGMAARELLGRRLASRPEWFPASALPADMRILNEQTIFGADGSEHRPDRVVLRGREAAVIDYKFGSRRDSYRRQVMRYVSLLRELGYTVTSAVVWYVENDETDIVNIDPV